MHRRVREWVDGFEVEKSPNVVGVFPYPVVSAGI